jgi:hypothetical protein
MEWLIQVVGAVVDHAIIKADAKKRDIMADQVEAV